MRAKAHIESQGGLAVAAGSDLLVAPDAVVGSTANCCEDCPDTNTNPPDRSECPYFEVHAGVPTCTREGSIDEQIQKAFFGPQGLAGKTALIAVIHDDRLGE